MKVKLCLSTLESRENPSGWVNTILDNLPVAPVQTETGECQYPIDNNPTYDLPLMGPPWQPRISPPIMMSPTGEMEGFFPPVASPPAQTPSTPPVDQLAPPSVD